MNGYERYMATMEGHGVDFLPRVPILMQFAAEYIGSDYGRFAADYRVLVEANAACARDFGIDQLSCISDPYRETQGFGSEVEYVCDGPPRSTHPLERDKDFSVLDKPDPLLSERMVDRVHAAGLYKDLYGGKYSILGWVEGPAAEAADLRGVTNYLMDLMDDRDYICKLMDRCVEVGIDFARAQIKAGADTVGIGDAIASQIDPRTYRELILPRERRLVRAIQDAGAYAKLHICGNITHLLEGISELGVDILDLDHMVDLTAARKKVGENVVLTGNMDPVAVVQNSDPAVIRKAVLEAHSRAGDPYMVNAGCEIPSGTPMENLRALCEAVEG